MKFIKHLTFSMLALAAVASCSEEDLDQILGKDSTAMAQVYVNAEAQFLNLYNRIDQAMRDSVVITTGTAILDEAVVTLTTDSLVINFGNNNKLCADGKQRRGKIVAAKSGDFLNVANSTLSVLLVNFHVDDVPIGCEMDLRNAGLNAANQPVFVADTAYVSMGGDYMFGTTKELTFVNGFSTLYNTEDDSYSISGSAVGSSVPDNGTYSASISSTNPLLYDRACAYKMVSGEVNLAIQTDTAFGLSVDFLDTDGCGNLVRIVQDNGGFFTLPFGGF